MRRGDLLLIVSAGCLIWGAWQFSARVAFLVYAAMAFAAWYYFVDGEL